MQCYPHATRDEPTMKIYFTAEGDQDAVLSDSVDGLRALHDLIESFVASNSQSLRIAAHEGSSPGRYDELLAGLNNEKADSLTATIGRDWWIYLTASSDALRDTARRIATLDDTQHTHIYSTPMALIVDALNERE
jgi:hypothetical protein